MRGRSARRVPRRLVRALTFAALMAAALWAAAPAAPAAQRRQARSEFDPSVGTIRGPLSDFWLKVRSEWSGYLQNEQSPAPGGSILNRRTLQSPPPGRVWVSLVHGDIAATGDSPRRDALAHLYKEFLYEWKKAEGRNWPYAQIYDRTWEKMGKAGRGKNIIMIGTPWALPPVGPLARRLGFEISAGRIDVGKRKYRGDNLVLVFIAPNPDNPGKYALVITGSGDEALLQASDLPYGETDYAVFRGRRLLESGMFSKRDPASWGPPVGWQAKGTHHGFAIRESAHYTVWYEPNRLHRDEVDRFVRDREADWPALTALAPAARGHQQRITWFLYPSIDRKIDETARDGVVHLDPAASEIHAVYSATQRVEEPYLDLMILLHRALGPTRVPRLERALAIALAPDFEGRDVTTIAGRLFADARGRESAVLKSLRDHDVMTPADGPPAAHDMLLAGFMKALVSRQGRERAFEFVEQASPRDLDGAFQAAFGRDLGDAIDEWADHVRATYTAPQVASEEDASEADHPEDGTSLRRGLALLQERRDEEAAEALEAAIRENPADHGAQAALGRVHFRRGRFDRAEAASRRAIELCGSEGTRSGGCAASEAWARLTVGRVEALRGRTVAAHLELTHPAARHGPAPVPTLAEYWLETMNQSRNQLTVVSHHKREARVSLRRLDWRAAESELRRALEIDPGDGEAHRLLSEVYHKQHEYWSWRIRYLNEVHPDYNVLGRVYLPGELSPFASRVESLHSLDSFNDLVLRGNVELLKAQAIYAAEIQNLHAEGDRHLIERRDLAEALKAYRRALGLNEDFFLSHFLVGRCYFLMDRAGPARQSFEEVLRRQPSDPLVLAWTHTYLGYLSLQEDDMVSARRSFERAIHLVGEGKVATLARDGLGKVDTIRMLMP